MEFFDSHSHYNDEKFDEDREKMVKDTIDSGITKFMCVGYNLEKSKKAIEIANQYENIYASVGISPNDTYDYSDEKLKEIEELAKDKKVVAIGEIGLDYFWNKENKDQQKELLIKQIEIANKLNKPIIIHNRDAYKDMIEILHNYPVYKKGVFHCCPLNQELIKDGLELGYFISFSGVITFKNAKPDGPVSLVPVDKILIETDSPYLTPEPHRGERNNSINVKYVAKKIAEIKGETLEKIAEITYNNAKTLFDIK